VSEPDFQNTGRSRSPILHKLGAGIAIIMLAPLSISAQPGKVTVEKVAYQGWQNNLRVSNGQAELILTLDVGPRIISYRLANGKNVFKNYPDQMGKSGEKEWMIRGGHRLWLGPEDLTRTYALDNSPIKYEDSNGTIRLIPPPDSEYGIQKELTVRLAPSGSNVSVLHRITNIGAEPVELAPWVLTVMAPGGVEIIPLPAKHPHPGPPKNARSPKDYAANQFMTIWPFFDFADSRWHFGSRFITLRQDATKGPTKIGLAHQLGWIGYLNQGTLFVKRFGYEEGRPYPDNGVNFETFTNEDMLEIESLGTLSKVGPGKSVEHTEHWELFGGVGGIQNEEEIAARVLPHVNPR
jgi:hypothetical protein